MNKFTTYQRKSGMIYAENIAVRDWVLRAKVGDSMIFASPGKTVKIEVVEIVTEA